ncbi:MAG TPA: FHA domain-containing protein [Tepidisphaeraceae bacterium]|jgi:predicted component of type VI protein secretion system|nr:FHA domain-containing protein [Tepidisphaeraceae bacterium]
MAYLIISDKIGEFERQALGGPVTIGRSPDCDVSIRDILLSRKHCRLEQVDGQWVVTDLDSKNGTIVAGAKVKQFKLEDGQTIRIGRTKVNFFAGDIADAPAAPAKRERPADPVEALAGTMAGFEFKPPVEADEIIADIPKVIPLGREQRDQNARPTPKPRPVAKGADQAQEMLLADSSNSWESIYAEARQSVALEASPNETWEHKPRPNSPIDMTIHTNLKTGGRAWRGLRATVKRAWSKITRPTSRTSVPVA